MQMDECDSSEVAARIQECLCNPAGGLYAAGGFDSAPLNTSSVSHPIRGAESICPTDIKYQFMYRKGAAFWQLL